MGNLVFQMCGKPPASGEPPGEPSEATGGIPSHYPTLYSLRRIWPEDEFTCKPVGETAAQAADEKPVVRTKREAFFENGKIEIVAPKAQVDTPVRALPNFSGKKLAVLERITTTKIFAEHREQVAPSMGRAMKKDLV